MGQNKRAGKKEQTGGVIARSKNLQPDRVHWKVSNLQCSFTLGGRVRVRKLRLRFQENKLS